MALINRGGKPSHRARVWVKVKPRGGGLYQAVAWDYDQFPGVRVLSRETYYKTEFPFSKDGEAIPGPDDAMFFLALDTTPFLAQNPIWRLEES
jgi:hypothetical protein